MSHGKKCFATEERRETCLLPLHQKERKNILSSKEQVFRLQSRALTDGSASFQREGLQASRSLIVSLVPTLWTTCLLTSSYSFSINLPLPLLLVSYKTGYALQPYYQYKLVFYVFRFWCCSRRLFSVREAAKTSVLGFVDAGIEKVQVKPINTKNGF